MQPASVGRIVHYVSYGSPVRDDLTQQYPSECRAAIVTEVFGPLKPFPEYLASAHGKSGPEWEHWATMTVFTPQGHFTNTGPYDGSEDPAPGTWHWPERV